MISGDKSTSILSPILKLAANQAATILLEEFKLQWHVKKEIENMKEKLILIQNFLDDAELKQHRKHVEVWVENLQDVAYDAEDVLDEVATEASQLKLMGAQKDWIRQVSDFFLSCFTCSITSSFMFRRGIAIRIKQIREKLDEIVKSGRDLGIQESMVCQSQPDDTRPERETSSFPVELDVVGRTKERDLVKSLLLSDSDDATASESICLNFSAISIAGMGALGKTTLAQVVYDHPEVTGHFHRRIWAHVSDRLNVSRLITNMIETATGCRPHLETLEALQSKLAEMLKKRRFLLVLDDVWDEPECLWKVLLQPLNCGLRGSKVIMTTRNQSAAGIRVPTTLIKLGVMSNDECWSIFKNHALVGASPGDCNQLETMRKKIVEMAKGVPLAAKALGGLATSIRLSKQRRWSDLLKNEQEEDGVDIISVLRLSYQQLLAPLKQCFAYCAVFPKGYVFSKTWLIQIWMALGFIQVRGAKRMEDIGSDYFETLLRRSFFQGSQGGGFMMHDFMHDLARTVSRDGYFRQEDNSPLPSPGKVRHLSLSTVNPELLGYLQRLPKLRSLIFLNQDESLSVHDLQKLFKILRNLRVLHLSRIAEPSYSAHGFWSCIFPAHLCGICSNNFPDSICSLSHLRYLRIFADNIVRLPESLNKLYNLQNLRLEDSRKLRTLPNGVTNLVNLRHLEVEGDDKVYEIAGIGKLTSLQKLEKFSISRETGRGIGELKDLNELQGKLSISGLENVASGKEAREVKLHEKHDIDVLKLKWCGRSINMIDSELDEEILEGLKPPTGLKELIITNYGGTRSPRWMLDQSLVSLEIVRLVGCRKWKVLPPLGQLPFPGVLEMSWMDGGQKSGNYQFYDDGGCTGILFPSLRRLQIRNSFSMSPIPTLPPTLTEVSIDTLCYTIELVLPKSSNMTTSPSSNRLKLSDCTHNTICWVWEELIPHHLWALNELTICNCPLMFSLPRDTFVALVTLRKLTVSSCQNLEQLPLLPPTLVELKLSEVGLSVLPDIFSSGKSSSAAAASTISNCPQMFSLPRDTFGALVSLRKLTVISCWNLKQLPLLPPTLVELKLSKVRLSVLPDISDYPGKSSSSAAAASTSLSILELSGCPYLESLHEGLLTKDLKALKKLIIHDCVNLESLSREGFEGLVSLIHLDISDCPKLRQLPPLPSVLEYFGLSKVGLQALPEFWALDGTGSSSSSSPPSLSGPCLSKLEISECHELTSLCHGLLGQDLRSLEEVFICCCSGLVSLPGFRGFNSLRLLTVAHCSNLMSLPWDALPVSLKTLEIDNCPLLMNQCQQEGCADRPNISSPQIKEFNGRWRRKNGH